MMGSTLRIGSVSKFVVTLTVTIAATVVVSAAAAANQQSSVIPYLSHGVGVTTPTFEPIASPAQQFGGTAELPAGVSEGAGAVTPTNLARAVVPQKPEISYLSWGVSADSMHEVFGIEQSALVRNDRRIERDMHSRETPQVASAASSHWFDVSEGALGLALGLTLTAALAGLLAMSRNRLRIAHP